MIFMARSSSAQTATVVRRAKMARRRRVGVRVGVGLVERPDALIP
jgi:hypothetical protein